MHFEADGAMHACPVPNCGYTTPSEDLLAAHAKTHPAAAPAPQPGLATRHCPVPGCSFFSYTTNLLTRHFTAAHVGAQDAEGYYPCATEGCEFKTKRRIYLVAHAKRVHPEGRFVCKTCAMEFPTRSECFSHSMSKHVIPSRKPAEE